MKKGFTLVELLAIIIILSALSYITATSIGGIFKKSKNEVYDTQLNLVKISAENWVQENPKYVQIATSTSGEIVEYLTIADLKESGLMDEIYNPKTGEPFTNDELIVKVTSEYNEEYGRNIIKYEVIDDATLIAEIKSSKNNITSTLNTDDLTTKKVYIITYIGYEQNSVDSTGIENNKVQFTAEEGENFTATLPKSYNNQYPATVTVMKSNNPADTTKSYNSTTGVISISNVLGNITITGYPSTYTVDYKYVSCGDSKEWVYAEKSLMIKFTTVPVKYEITMGGTLLTLDEDYTYDSSSKTIVIPKVVGNVVVHGWYTVTYDSNGGSSVNKVNVKGGNTISSSPSTTKAGYTFGGWYKESSLSNEFNFETDKVTSNKTLYAKWITNTSSIVINKDGSSWSGSGMKIDLSTSSTNDTATFTQTVSSGSTATLEKIVTGTTYYIWAGRNGSEKTTTAYTGISIKGAEEVSSTINYYTITKSQGVGTTLTIKQGNSSGTSLGTTQVLKGQSVYITATLDAAYKDLVLKYGDTTISSGTTKQVTVKTTILSSATLNQVTCEAGTYLPKNSTTCTACEAGSYCTGGTLTASTTADVGKTSCPSGYTSAASATAQSKCYISVAAGKYLKTAKTATTDSCEAGTYKAKHNVYYGNTSSCAACEAGNYCPAGAGSATACPSGYTSAASATAQSKCYISVAAGKYLKTANTTTTDSCAAGTYNAKHNVYYGNTSSCTACAAGYYSSAGASSCTACASGKYTNTGNSTGATSCSTCTAGYYCNGKTQTACPSGYTSSAGAKTSSDCSLKPLTVTNVYYDTLHKSCCNASRGWKYGWHMYASYNYSEACPISSVCFELQKSDGTYDYNRCGQGVNIGDVIAGTRNFRATVTDSCGRTATGVGSVTTYTNMNCNDTSGTYIWDCD